MCRFHGGVNKRNIDPIYIDISCVQVPQGKQITDLYRFIIATPMEPIELYIY